MRDDNDIITRNAARAIVTLSIKILEIRVSRIAENWLLACKIQRTRQL